VNHLLRLVLRDPSSAFAVVLNQDCYLKPEALERIYNFMLKHPKCAIAGIKQLSSTNEDQIIHGGTYECFPAGRHVGGKVSHGDCTANKQVPWVNGACMVVRLEALQDFGIMDETMKMFASDADWSYTARARGWETWYIADAECVHEQGASQTMDTKMQKVFEKDMLTFRSKWVDGDLYRDLSLEIFSEEDVCEEVVA
jgi:GT2 family glycosyltransferase